MNVSQQRQQPQRQQHRPQSQHDHRQQPETETVEEKLDRLTAITRNQGKTLGIQTRQIYILKKMLSTLMVSMKVSIPEPVSAVPSELGDEVPDLDDAVLFSVDV